MPSRPPFWPPPLSRRPRFWSPGPEGSPGPPSRGARQYQILRAQEGESEAIQTMLRGDQRWQGHSPAHNTCKYLEMLPKIADGRASQLWMLPPDLTGTFRSISRFPSGQVD